MDTGDREGIHTETRRHPQRQQRQAGRETQGPQTHSRTTRLGQHSPVNTGPQTDSRTPTTPHAACSHRPSSSHQLPTEKEGIAWWEGRSGEIPRALSAQSGRDQSLSRAGSGQPRPRGGTEQGGWPLEAWAQALTYGAEGELSRRTRVDGGHRGSKGRLRWPRWGSSDRGHPGTPSRHGGRRADRRLALSNRPPPPRPGGGPPEAQLVSAPT